MQPWNAQLVDRWWADLFGAAPAELWQAPTVRPHSVLGDYPGWFVAWRDRGVHVSAPAGTREETLSALLTTTPQTLASSEFWASLAERHGLVVRGPATHHFLDVDPGADTAVEVDEVDPDEVDALRDLVGADDWEESALGSDERSHGFVVREGTTLLAAAILRPFADHPRDIGVLVAPDARGRGLGALVGRAAASYAVREHGFARWPCRTDNAPSLAVARRLGFEPWCTQLAVRPA